MVKQHHTDASDAEISALPKDLKEFFAKNPVPRGLVALLMSTGISSVKQFAALGSNDTSTEELFNCVEWSTAGDKKKNASQSDKLRIKSITRAFLFDANQKLKAPEKKVPGNNGNDDDDDSYESYRRERSELEGDPAVPSKLKKVAYTQYQELHGWLPGAYDRPHDRVLGKILPEAKSEVHKFFPLTKVYSETDEPAIRSVRTTGRTDIEQLAEQEVRGKSDFLRRLSILMLAYVLSAAAAAVEGGKKLWVSAQQAYDYLLYVRLRADEFNVDLAKLSLAEQATRQSWADRVAFHDESLGEAMSKSPDSCQRFWGDLTRAKAEKRDRETPFTGPKSDPKRAKTFPEKPRTERQQLASMMNLGKGSANQICGDFNFGKCDRSKTGPNACRFQHVCGVCSNGQHHGLVCPTFLDAKNRPAMQYVR